MSKFVILPLLLCCTFAIAQKPETDSTITAPLSEVTIVANRTKTIAGAGHYIGSSELNKLNQPNINQVLKSLPGVYVRDEEGFGLRPNIGLRGTSVNRSAKITLLEDGILIAPAPYADPSAYYFPSFARMQGVEVLKGSSQIQYGPYTMGGAVNLLSTAIPQTFKAFALLSYGSFNTNQQRLWVGDSRKNFDYVFEVNRLASNGYKQLDGGGNTGFDRRDVMGKLRWHSPANAAKPQSLTLKFVNTTELGNESYLGLTYNDFKANPLRRYAGTQKDLLDLNHQSISLSHNINPLKKLSINTTAYFAKTYRDWARANSFGGKSINTILNDPNGQQAAYNIMTGQANGNVDFQSAARSYFSKGLQLNSNYTFKTANLNHHILLGLRYHKDEADRYATRSVYAMTNGTMILTAAGVKGNQENQIREANSFASFIQYNLTLKAFTLSPGIRYEKINLNFTNYGNADNGRQGANQTLASNTLDIVLPGIGLHYKFNKIMNAFAGVHRGFSPPGTPSTQSGEIQASPELSVNYEIGYRAYLQAVQIQAVAFLNDYTNIVGSDNVSGGGAGTGDLFNAGEAKIKGLELSLGYNLLHNNKNDNSFKLPLSIAYTYTSARFKEHFVNAGGDWGGGIIQQDDIIPFITPHLLSVGIGIEHKKYNVSLSTRYTGTTRIKPGKDAAIFPAANVSLAEINNIKRYFIADVSANYQLKKQVSLFTLVNNITNSKAIVTNLPQGYRPNIPLSFSAGLKANL